MKDFDFDSKEFLEKEAKLFLQGSIANAFTQAEKKGKITGLNSLLDFREEMESELLHFLTEFIKARQELLNRQQELLQLAYELNSQAQKTKLLKESLTRTN